jgi:polyisoprenoid-binding protein YceI
MPAARPRRRRTIRVAAVLAACGIAACGFGGRASAAPGAWTADPAASRFTFSATLAGGEFEGSFGDYTVDIVFDPADLAGSRFQVVVRTATARTGDTERDQALAGPEFFATSRYTTATWVADRFEATGPGRWIAHGRLTLRGVTRSQDVACTFVEQPAAGTARLAGTALVRRLDYGIGQGDWQDTSVLGNEVRLSFDLVLRRK